jgi:sodium/pantothenate symporter
LGGIVLAGIVAGIQTTVAAMAIIITSSIARNVLREYKPNISPEAVKAISRWTMGICLILSIALALFQPKLIQWIILFSVGGMEAITFGPILLGLFWPRGNKWGTMAAIFWGMVTYTLGNTILPQINIGGMHSSFVPVVTSVLVYIIVSLATSPPSDEVVQIFWGSSKKRA